MKYADYNKRRDQLIRRVIFRTALIIVVAVTGLAGLWQERRLAHVDYYQILVSELTRRHYLMTGTPTALREEERTREFFEQQLNLRNRRDGLPDAEVRAPSDGLTQFSFLPGGAGPMEIPSDYLIQQQTGPSMTFTEPSGTPMALWVYSRPERLLSCIFFETPDRETLNAPGLRILEAIERSRVIAEHGKVTDGALVAVHAYLIALGDLKLENLNYFWKPIPDLSSLNYRVPLLFGSGAKAQAGENQIKAQELLPALQKLAPSVWLQASRIIIWLLFPLSLLWLSALWKLRRLRREYLHSLSAELEPEQIMGLPSFWHFLSADLESEAAALIDDLRARRAQIWLLRDEEAEKQELKAQLETYRLQFALPVDEAAECEKVIQYGSLNDLRLWSSRFRLLIQQQAEKIESQRQLEREQRREIEWLESEFEAIPVEKRETEAREAWALYKEASAQSDLRHRLRQLKEARKKLPRELRPERF